MTTSSSWVVLRIDVQPAVAEAVVALLETEGVPGVVREASELRPGRTRVEAHLPGDEVARVEQALARMLGDDAEAIATAPVGEVDWTALARRHHRPQPIGRRLLVAPPWDIPAAGEREFLVVEPGMAFGTGQHATTRGCLEAIEDLLAASPVETALDVGTGSGILALALARLGVPHVVACDLDPAVLPIARVNLTRNHVAHVALVAGTAAAFRSRFDLVLANLLAEVLAVDAQALAARVAPEGHLIASGLLRGQTTAVRAAYPGWRVVDERGDDEWRTLVFRRNG